MTFNITVVSENPLTVQDILSALIQTLRARGFTLLEQDSNLLITKSGDINQIATLVTPENPDNKHDSPIVTRVFRIQNASLTSIANIIKPMISKNAMLDVSPETRQLIVTDITTNVDKIAKLLITLDSNHSPLDIETYRAKNMSAESLILLTKQLVQPFAEENPLIFVPQVETNSIFIVSTPYLIERSVAVMEDLDSKPKDARGPLGDQVFLYPLVNKSAPELLEALKQVGSELEGTGPQSAKLIAAFKSAKWVKDSNSILFVTDLMTQPKLEELLKTLDTVSATSNYYVYKIQKAGREQIEGSLEELTKSLKKGTANRDLVEAISSMRYIKESDSLVFTGSDEALKKLKDLLPTFDSAAATPSSHFYLYTPQFLSGKELEEALAKVGTNLCESGLSDPSLLNSLRHMKWVPSTNTILFSGNPSSLDSIQLIIKMVDVATGAPSQIFLYKPKNISNEQIEEALDELADKLDHKNLSDRNLSKAIDNLTWIKDSQIFLFKADPGTITKLDSFLKGIDTPKEAQAIASAYFLYKLKFARGEDVIDHLERIAKGLPEKDPDQKAIIHVIDHATVLRDTNAILLTGTQKAVEEVKALISQFDDKEAIPPAYEKTSFFIYKPTHLSPSELEEALKETALDLKNSGLIDPNLLQSIATLRVVDMTGSLLFTGSPESLEKTKEIISSTDIEGATRKETTALGGQTFLVYKVRYVPIAKLLQLLGNVATNLEKTPTIKNKAVGTAIKGAKEIKESNSLIFTGPEGALQQISDLLKQLDTPSGIGGGELGRQPGTYVVYKPVHISGPELLEMMRDFERNLQQTGVQEPHLFETIDHLKYIERTGYILISGDEKSVEKVREMLTKFDITGAGSVTALNKLQTSFLVYKLQYHLGGELQETLKKVGQDLSTANPHTVSELLAAINSIQWIKMTNSLLATGTPEVLTQLKELIQNIDTPLRQVFIEVLIIQTKMANTQQFGLQWGSKFKYLDRFAGGVSNFPSSDPLTLAAGNTALSTGLTAVNETRTPLATDIPNPITSGGFDLGVIGDIILHKGKSFVSLASLVTALEGDGDAVIVMNPKIIGQDNMQSTIFVGENIPFTGSQVNLLPTSGGTQIQTNIEYRDVGISLSITPILGQNDIITLDIANEITAQVANTTQQGSNANIQGLQTSRTALNARVHVPDKHFVALSAVIQDTKSHFRSGIPCLGGLPVIGAIFSENDRLNSRNNVIFFLRPVIIDSIEEYERVTQNQEELFKDWGSKQIIKEEIDEAIDTVRNPYCN
jgi:type II secretory pathway component GspD/PulD (secretin)